MESQSVWVSLVCLLLIGCGQQPELSKEPPASAVETPEPPAKEPKAAVTAADAVEKVNQPESRQVTDAGLQHLKGLNSIHTLDLRSTQVTDAGLQHLKGLTSLTVLTLYFTQVTDARVNELKESLPKLRMQRE